jgi:hypothetical protein
MAEIHHLPGVTAPDQPRELQPVPGIIRELELLLAEARSGHLRAIGIATVRAGDSAGSLWERPESGDHSHTLSAAISILWHRYHGAQAASSHPRPAPADGGA